LQIICIKSYAFIKAIILIQHGLKVQFGLLIIENLKEYELHFYLKKNDMLYTELNFARIWSSTAYPTPVFPPQILVNYRLWQDLGSV
jgi:hypothetical protein